MAYEWLNNIIIMCSYSNITNTEYFDYVYLTNRKLSLACT